MWVMGPKIKRWLSRATLRAHEAQVRTILSTLSAEELAECAMAARELCEMVERAHERRKWVE